jgi:hypothetical protein
MTALNNPKPNEPRPEDFALTEERARRFREPFGVIDNPWFILTVLLFSVLASVLVTGSFFTRSWRF